uniref:DDE_3 domain-containing protein n=2 Tax=Caenorhabditis japonica TaxID=281687 RepID=A0A8R1E8X0_CAEJA
TESKILPGSVDVVISNRPSSEILVDYHQCMDAQMYEKYMKAVLPLIAAAAPVGRQPILVIDNASIHNTVVAKIPTKSSSKQSLVDFLADHGVAASIFNLKDDLWKEVEDFINSRGGRNSMKKYLVDEYAATLGVKIVRLPPYHCQFSPIELIWNQLKSYLRSAGKTSDKLEVVRARAIEWLQNKCEADISWTYEHVLDIEEGIKNVMEQDTYSSDSECDTSESE